MTSISFRQLCAVARAEAGRQDDSEWVDRIKCRLVALGFSYPKPHEITSAIRAVEHVRTHATR